MIPQNYPLDSLKTLKIIETSLRFSRVVGRIDDGINAESPEPNYHEDANFLCKFAL